MKKLVSLIVCCAAVLTLAAECSIAIGGFQSLIAKAVG